MLVSFVWKRYSDIIPSDLVDVFGKNKMAVCLFPRRWCVINDWKTQHSCVVAIDDDA
jgi:hypothetical protein